MAKDVKTLTDENKAALEYYIRNDNHLTSIYKKIESGTATFEDASAFALRLGQYAERTLIDSLIEAEFGEDLISYVGKYAGVVNKINNSVCRPIQKNLNLLAETSIEPLTPKPRRVQNFAKSIKEAEGLDALVGMVRGTLSTMAQASVDDWIRTNASFQAKAGFKPLIVRKWSGRTPTHDTRHTDECRHWAGRWIYGEQPDFAFMRHNKCTCSVQYFPSEAAEGRITALAKGDKDEDKVLWNTGETFSNSRKAVLRRRREQLGSEEARKILNQEWKGGRNGQAERHFSKATSKPQDLSKLTRKQLEDESIKAYIKNNKDLGEAEARRRAKALLPGNSDAQLRLYLKKHG